MRVRSTSVNHFPALMRRIQTRLAEFLDEDAEDYVELLADEAPKRTGALSRSFVVQRTSDRTRTVESTLPYALPVARGHHTASGSWVPANPFDERAKARLNRKRRKRSLL